MYCIKLFNAKSVALIDSVVVDFGRSSNWIDDNNQHIGISMRGDAKARLNEFTIFGWCFRVSLHSAAVTAISFAISLHNFGCQFPCTQRVFGRSSLNCIFCVAARRRKNLSDFHIAPKNKRCKNSSTGLSVVRVYGEEQLKQSKTGKRWCCANAKYYFTFSRKRKEWNVRCVLSDGARYLRFPTFFSLLFSKNLFLSRLNTISAWRK